LHPCSLSEMRRRRLQRTHAGARQSRTTTSIPRSLS
jgi:hypothetical protein